MAVSNGNEGDMSPTVSGTKAVRRPIPSFLLRARAETLASSPSDVCKTHKAPPVLDVDSMDGSQRTDRVFHAMRGQAYALTRKRKLCGSGDRGRHVLYRPIMNLVAAESERGGDGLTHNEISSTAVSIARFCATKLRPSNWAPRDSRVSAHRREHREVLRRTVSVFFEWGPAITIKGVARQTDRAKATVHRDLMSQQIAPRREAKIRRLPRAARRLVRILDRTLPSYGRRRLLSLNELAAATFTGEASCRTALSMRQKRTREALAVITSSNLGLHTYVVGDKVAVSRGILWHSFGHIAVFAATTPLSGLPSLPKAKNIPIAVEAAEDLLAILSVANCHQGKTLAEAVWRLGYRCAPILDVRPLRHLVGACVRVYDASDLQDLALAAAQAARRNGDPLNMKDLGGLIRAATAVYRDLRYCRDAGEAIWKFIEDSGYAGQSENSSRAGKRLATLRGMAVALHGMDLQEAGAVVVGWKERPETAPAPWKAPRKAPLSPFEGLTNEIYTVDIAHKIFIEEASLSQFGYQ